MEVELKAKAPVGIEAKLKKARAKKLATRNQTDTIYDLPGEKLGKKGVTLRVREEGDTVFLTYKSKSKSKTVKAKEEIELTTNQSAHLLLKGLGYEPVFVKQKHRVEYSLDGVTVSIDKVKGLGTWVEFEVFGKAEPSRKKIVAVASKLGIPEKRLSTESYIHLLRKKKGLPCLQEKQK